MRWNAGRFITGKKVAISIACLAVAAFCLTYKVLGISAAFTNGQGASDVIGQYDSNDAGFLTPTYTKGATNDGPRRTDLGAPQGIAVDSVNHRLFVAEGRGGTYGRILSFDLDSNDRQVDMYPDNVIGQDDYNGADSTVASGVSATRFADFPPLDLSYDAVHSRLFALDSFNSRVLVYDLSGGITDGMAASFVIGQPDFTSNATNLTQDGLTNPIGMSYDATHDKLYVADASTRVLVFDTTTITNGMNAQYVLGQADFTSNVSAIAQNRIFAVNDVTVDGAGNRVFVVDGAAKRVLVYDISGGITNGMNAQYVLGQTNFTAGTDAVTQSKFSYPTDAVYDPTFQRLFVTDTAFASYPHRVMVFDLSGGVANGMNAAFVLGRPDFTSSGFTPPATDTSLDTPSNLALTADGSKLYVSDEQHARIMRFDLQTEGISDGMAASHVLGKPDFTMTTDPFDQSHIEGNDQVAYDTNHNYVFQVDYSARRVLVFNAADGITNGENALYVIGQPDFTTSNSTPTQTGLVSPHGVAYDTVHDRLFVADSYRVMVYDFSGAISNGMAAVHVLGKPDFTSGNNPTPSDTNVGHLNHLAYDEAGQRLFVSDSVDFNRIMVFDVATITDGEAAVHVLGQSLYNTTASATTADGMSDPAGLSFDANHNRLFVSDVFNSRVLVFDTTSITDGEAAVNVLGQTDFVSGGGGVGASAFQSPNGSAYDAIGNRFFLSDGQNNRILEFDMAGGITDGMAATHVIGRANFFDTNFSPGTPISSSHIKEPVGVAYDSNHGILFTADLGNGTPNSSRILSFQITPASVIANGMPATGELGQCDASVRDGSCTPIFNDVTYPVSAGNPYGFSSANDVALDTAHHRLFVADQGNSRVFEYDLNTDNTLIDHIVDHVIGQADFNDSQSVVAMNRLSGVRGVEYDATNDRLFVLDAHRVLVFDTSALADGMNASNVIGQADFTSSAAAVTAAGMDSPVALTYDDVHHHLFVADSAANRVTVYDTTAISDGMAAMNVLGQANFTSSGSATTASSFNGPLSLAFDATHGLLFVGEGSNTRVLVFDVNALTDGEPAINVLGEGDFTSSGYSTSASQFGSPTGLTYDTTLDRLFLSDAASNRVMVFHLGCGISDGMPASKVLGQTNFTNSGGATSQTRLRAPSGLAFDAASDMLYVADTSNNRVMQFIGGGGGGECSSAGVTRLFPTHVVGQYDLSDVETYTKALVNNGKSSKEPSGIALDDVSHELYVSDYSNHRILVYNLDSSNVLTDHTPDYVIGQPDFDTTTSNLTRSGLGQVAGLAVDTADCWLYAADSDHNRVMVYDTCSLATGMNASAVIGQADYTSSVAALTQSGLNGPFGLAFDQPNQRLYVSDTTNDRVLTYDGTNLSNGMDAEHVIGQPDFTTDNATVNASTLHRPIGIFFDDSLSRLFVGDTNAKRAVVFDMTAIADGEAAVNVLGQPDFVSSTSSAAQNTVDTVNAITYDAAHHILYLADANYYRVLSFDITGGVVDNMNAAHVLGEPDFTTTNSSGTLSDPWGLTYDAAHDLLYVADFEHTTYAFDAATLTDDEAPVGRIDAQDTGLNSPGGTAVDSVHHRLFVADAGNNRIVEYALDANNALTSHAAEHVLGQTDLSSSATAVNASGLYIPLGVAYDDVHDQLYVSDYGHSRVMVYDVASITDGEAAVHVLGQPDFTTATPAAASVTSLATPIGIAVDGTHNLLYVGDVGHYRVMVYDVASITDGESAVHVLGQPDFTTATPAAGKSGSGFPYGVASDDMHQRLFVAEVGFGRVTVFDVSSITDGETAVHVLGQPDLATVSPTVSQSGIGGPAGVAYNAGSDRLYVSDFSAHRGVLYDLASITDGQNAAILIGQNNYTLSSAHTTFGGMRSPIGAGFSAQGGLYVGDYGNSRVLAFDAGTPYYPVISAIATSGITQTDATVTWSTDIASDSVVEYGLTTGYGSSPSNGSLVTSHSIPLSGLTVGTLYHYRVKSTDKYGIQSVSSDGTFTTTAAPGGGGGNAPPPDTAPPVISGVSVSGTDVVGGGATIAWQTNEGSTSQIKFGLTASYGSTWNDGAFVVMHGTHLSGFADGTTYHFSVCSQDSASNVGCSPDATFTTATPTPAPDVTPPPQVIGFTAAWNGDFVALNWTNPPAPDFSGTLIMRSVGTPPSAPDQGTQVYRSSGTFITDSSVTPGVTYGYAAFTYDAAGNFSAAWTASVTVPAALVPPPPAVVPPPVAPPPVSPPPPVSGTVQPPTPGGTSNGSSTAGSGSAGSASGAASESGAGTSTGSTGSTPGGASGNGAGGASNTGTGGTSEGGSQGSNPTEGAPNITPTPDNGETAPPSATPVSSPNIFQSALTAINNTPAAQAVTRTTRAVIAAAQTPEVKAEVKNVVTPAVAVAAAANTAAAGAAAGAAFPYLTYLLSLATQPAQTIARRKRDKWGVVYNALTKLPVDLAIVRLRDVATGRVVRTSVTDRLGRYIFLVPPGPYKIEVRKAGFTHPTAYLKGQQLDARYAGIMPGEDVVVPASGTMTANIPLDPTEDARTPGDIRLATVGRSVQGWIGIVSIAAVAVSYLIVPSVQVLIFLGANVLSYAAFRRMAIKARPEHWGVVAGADGKPLSNAIVRIFDVKWNKLLETQVTDFRGRYAFLVGRNAYNVTIEKPGFGKVQRGPVDLTASTSQDAEIVAMDVRLEPVMVTLPPAAPTLPPAEPPGAGSIRVMPPQS
ncbi:MAG: hypothetical protein RLZZ324_831 [Candidatus Parcubacteria bacterium]